MSKDYETKAREYFQQCLSKWRRLVERLAGARASVEWVPTGAIIDILNEVGRAAPENVLLFPDGGDLWLTAAAPSREPGCIELHSGGPEATIVRPERLVLELPDHDDDAALAYFRLESLPLAPSGVYSSLRSDTVYEEVTDLGSEYAPFTDELPRGARALTRSLRGPFLLVSKGSPYLDNHDVFDGVHARFGAVQFRELLSEIARRRARRG